MKRKLSAILAADLVGYSRLIQADEEGTLSDLRRLREDSINPVFKQHNGRIVKEMGDGILVEFASVVDAVRAATQMQTNVKVVNESRPPDGKLEFRIGVNLGDVVIDGSDIQGDGVNLAARLEGLAQPGSVCITDAVHEQVRDRLNLVFENLGEREVKNIARPLRVWQWLADNGSQVSAKSSVSQKNKFDERPSIAVLPFINMSGDPDQDYFADGIVEDIITALSRLDQIFVVSRNSSFAYRDQSIDTREICRLLGVRYAVEGSLRKSGNRLRISCKLTEGETGSHLWVDRFDGVLEDVFDLQDQITESLILAVEPELRVAEIERSRSRRPDSIDAYDLYLRALPHLYMIQPDENLKATKLLKKAIELDPEYAPALAYAAWCYEQRITRGWDTIEEDNPAEAISLAKRAIATKSNNASALAAAGFVLLMVGRDYDVGLNTLQNAIAMSPNTVPILVLAGWGNNFAGKPEIAAPKFETARQHSPADPLAFTIKTGAAMSQLLMGHPHTAFDLAQEAMALYSGWDNTLLVLAAASHQMGNLEQAELAVSRLLEVAPTSTVSLYDKVMPFRHSEHADIILDGLRAGGMPE